MVKNTEGVGMEVWDRVGNLYGCWGRQSIGGKCWVVVHTEGDETTLGGGHGLDSLHEDVGVESP